MRNIYAMQGSFPRKKIIWRLVFHMIIKEPFSAIIWFSIYKNDGCSWIYWCVMFLWNCYGNLQGPVHAYVLVPGGKTCYLSELKSGKEVILVDQKGHQRTAIVGRTKIESRPLLLVEAKVCVLPTVVCWTRFEFPPFDSIANELIYTYESI